MKLSIVIPIFNEEKTISQLLQKVDKVDFGKVEKEIVIVDDCSSDGTSQILQKLKDKIKNLRIVTHEKNEGKGAAVRTGFQQAKGDYLVIQDADLEYNPEDLLKLLKPIVDGKTEVVYGTRLKRLPHLSKEERRMRFLMHYFGNRFLSLLTSILYGQWITDMETCYKIFPRNALQKFSLSGNGFEFEPEITAKLIRYGYHIVEVPISTTPRGYEEGKKLQTVPEGFKAVWTLLKYRIIK